MTGAPGGRTGVSGQGDDRPEHGDGALGAAGSEPGPDQREERGGSDHVKAERLRASRSGPRRRRRPGWPRSRSGTGPRTWRRIRPAPAAGLGLGQRERRRLVGDALSGEQPGEPRTWSTSARRRLYRAFLLPSRMAPTAPASRLPPPGDRPGERELRRAGVGEQAERGRLPHAQPGARLPPRRTRGRRRRRPGRAGCRRGPGEDWSRTARQVPSGGSGPGSLGLGRDYAGSAMR